jgi:RNA polymerase sigma-70 factor (ECF subfamily)
MKKVPHNPSDEELLRLMLAGDGQAFEQLYERWQGAIYRFALRMSGSETLAEDVTQDVFLRLMRDGWQYEARGSFAAYLLAMARHCLLRRLQQERRFVTFEAEADDGMLAEEQLVAETDPLAELTREEIIAVVQRAIEGLPLHYREVVLLCHLQELSYAEAAAVIGCEVGTVRSRLHRARALLAEKLRALRKADKVVHYPRLTGCLI